ncbi:AAA family ATPase [Streptomyces microflavus]|uniref:AAA family ATPase n=1 Tax=Streptomyces microflavus TaxID=1919 RepID=UPI0036913478
MVTFNQPGPVSDGPGPAGAPYPGAEAVAEVIERDREASQVAAQAKIEKAKHLARERGRADAEAESVRLRKVVVRKGADITMRRVRWLWAPGDDAQGRIPLGELTLMIGRGGIGKSTVLAEMTAWITTGKMRGEFWEQARDVLYVANEDSLEYTIVPRMIAAGADMNRVHFIGINMLDGRADKVVLPSDCDGLAEYAKEVGAVALMLDPLSSNIRARSNAGDEVRPVIEAVRRMAEGAGFAAIGLGHTRKAVSTNLMDAAMGSSELGNVCRSAMGVMADPDDEGTVILSQEKNNLGRTDIDSYRYRIQTATLWSGTEVIPTSKLEWLGRTPTKVSDMMADSIAAGATSKSGIDECMDFIRDYLMDPTRGGQALRGDIVKAASGEGHSRATVDRAAKRLGLKAMPSGQGAKRLWCLNFSDS